MYTRQVSPYMNKFSHKKREDSPMSQNQTTIKKNFILSFGVNNNMGNNEDFFNENVSESPFNHIENSLQNHNFIFNQNNITYLNSNHNSSHIQEDLTNLENELKHYQDVYEAMNRNYQTLLKKQGSLNDELKTLDKKIQIPQKFNPFLKKQENNAQEKMISAKIRGLETEVQDWKNKCELLEKEHITEMAQLKTFLKNSHLDSANNIPAKETETEHELIKLNERFHILMAENEKINSIVNQLISEINYLKKTSPTLKERHDYFFKVFSKVQESYESNEKKLLSEITSRENELNILKESSKVSLFESLIINNSSMIAAPEKKIEFLENENKKLEGEIENWKVQYWNLEKKVKKNELNINPELKYTEIDLKEILNKVNRQHFHTQNELLNKMNVLEHEIKNLSRKNINIYENPINLKQLASPDKNFEAKTIKNQQNQQIIKNAQSEKKSKTNNIPLGFYNTLKIKNVGESDKKYGYKIGIYSNSLGNANNTTMTSLSGYLAKKENAVVGRNNTLGNYTEKILKKMRK